MNGLLEERAAVDIVFIFQIIYGGRVLDDFDKRLLNTYLNEYFGDFLFNKFHTFNFEKNEDLECVVLPVVATSFQEFRGDND